MKGEWPLVGRTAELERLDGLRRGGAGGVVVAGPAGVGKTRLATECLARAAADGLVPVRVAATQAAARLPFGAFAALLPDFAEGADRAAILRHVARTVAGRGEGKRAALLVDDAHLLDDESAAVTHLLASGSEVFVIATVRSGEPASDAVLALWKDGLAERVELAPLSLGDVEALLAAVLGGTVDGAAVHVLHERSEGNVLFLRELVMSALDSHALRMTGGLWRLHGTLATSTRLVELVEARLAGLRPADRAALETLALGEPLGVDLLQGLEPEASLDALEQRGLLRIEALERRLEVRLAHPLQGDVLRARLSPLRTRAISRRLADGLEACGNRRGADALRMATWRLDAGGPYSAELMLTAAQAARTRSALHLAERMARAAAEAGAGFDAGMLLGQLCWLQGRADEAEQILAGLVAKAPDDKRRAMLALTRIDNLLWGPGRVDEALALAAEAELTVADMASRDEIAAKRAMILNHSGRLAEAWELMEPILGRAEGGTLASVCFSASAVLREFGRFAEAVEVSQRALAAHTVAGIPYLLGSSVHVVQHGYALVCSGRLFEAEALAADAYQQAVGDPSEDPIRATQFLMVRTLLARGRVALAVQATREVLGFLKDDLSYRPPLRLVLITLAYALAQGGEAAEARATLTELDALGLPAHYIYGPGLLQARAWAEAASGDLSEAVNLLIQAAELARSHGELVSEADALHDLVRLGHGREVAGRLAELARVIEGDLVQVRASHAAAVGRGDPVALEQVSIAFETMGADLLAAEATADAAVAWRKVTDGRRAAAAERRAQTLVARCPGARTPALGSVTVRAALSARELEIARLAAAGVPNKEIAARLFLSVRTVENKLHAAYEKLGIAGRAELAESLEGG